MLESITFASVICDVLRGEKSIEDYAIDLGEINFQIFSARKMYGELAEVKELERLEEIIVNIITYELYAKIDSVKKVPDLALVK